MNPRPTLSQRLAQIFALDVRSLAVFRMALGAILLADLAVRATDFSAMYGPDGIAPVEVVRPLVFQGQWSLHLASGAEWFQAAMFIVAAALAGALAVGYRTRWATIGSWVMLTSLHTRMPLVLNAGDTMLRVMLFWGMWLPLGRVWSMDAWRAGRGAARSSAGGPFESRLNRAGWLVVSAATAAFVVQLAIVYWLAGLGKWNERWLGGTALGDVFAFRFYGEPLGRWLLNYPTLVHWLDLATLVLEIVGPCLLFVPWAQGWVRLALVAAFVAFHLGIAATITVGLFPWVGVAAWMAIVPGWVWDRWAGRSSDAIQRSIVPPLAPPFQGGRLETVCCAAALAVAAYLNIAGLTKWRAPAPIHAAMQRVGGVTGLRQSWLVFAKPPKFDALFVYQGRLGDGRLVDLYTGRPLDEANHASLAPNELPNHRWRKLHLRVLSSAFGGYRRSLADYVCRQWNATHGPDEQAVRIDFYCLRRPVAATDDEAFVRINLARIVLDEKWGNFSEALRELGP